MSSEQPGWLLPLLATWGLATTFVLGFVLSSSQEKVPSEKEKRRRRKHGSKEAEHFDGRDERAPETPKGLRDPSCSQSGAETPKVNRRDNGISEEEMFEKLRKPRKGFKMRDADVEGFSTEDARIHNEELSVLKVGTTPREVLHELQKGNTRFWMNRAHRPETSAFERRALIIKQHPSTAILSCSDSRVPTEIVFDQGLGDLFVIRNAGNFLHTSSMGSIEYAVEHLQVKVLVIMGHEGCGAVKAAVMPQEQLDACPAALRHLLMAVRAGLNQEVLREVSDARANDREGVVMNIRQQMNDLQNNDLILRKVAENSLILISACYEISSGIVDFIHELVVDPKWATDTKPGAMKLHARLVDTGSVAVEAS